MKHLFVLLSLLLTWSGAYAQNEKQTPVTKLPGEENLSLRERAERDFLMPVRRKKAVAEAPKSSTEDNTAAPESDATAHYAESADEAREAAVPAHTTRSYEARHADWLAARRAAARREESRAEARAEARRAARHSSSRSHSSKSKASKAKAHSSKSSKTKVKTKSVARSSKSKSKSSKAKAKSTHTSAKKSSSKKAAADKTAKKVTPSKSKSKTKHRR